MKKDNSYGFVPFYINNEGDIEILLVEHHAGHWGLPKGHKEGNETNLEAAKRELVEETGIKNFKVIDESKNFSQRYVAFHPEYKEVDKIVYYFLAQVFDKNIDTSRAEIKNAKWAGYSEYENIVTHKNTADVIDEAIIYLKENGSI